MTANALEHVPGHDGSEWAERCGYWLKALEAGKPKRKRRERESQPLILNGHGLSISVDAGTLIIKDGHTHYPAEQHERRFFKGELTLPPRIVLVDGSGNITLDALDWLAEQRVDLIRLKWDGRIVTMAGTDGYSADRRKVTWQIATRANEAKRVAFAVPLIEGKVKGTLFNLEHLSPESPSRDKAIEKAKAALKAIRTDPPETISELLGIEGGVAQGYFFAWRTLDMKWKAVKRYPIPDEWRAYLSRSALRTKHTIRNHRATHPINAMLNYAYGMLESSVRIQAIADGYDPSIGIIHGDLIKPDRHTFVFDLMEPQRPVVDRGILKLIQAHTFSGGDFMLQKDGVVRLNPELVRNLISTIKSN